MEGDPGIVIVFGLRCISIHSLRMEGDLKAAIKGNAAEIISIHSLRMEGDGFFVARNICRESISIHSLRMEGDKNCYMV